ncbi:MAG: hypothetical protein WC069_01025 [Candidatus Shapirobacteria bacterium]
MKNSIDLENNNANWSYPTRESDRPVIGIMQFDGAIYPTTQSDYSAWVDQNAAEINKKLGLTADGKEK